MLNFDAYFLALNQYFFVFGKTFKKTFKKVLTFANSSVKIMNVHRKCRHNL